MSFIIDPSSANFEDIKQDVLDFLLTQPDSDQWTLFFEGASGQKLVELVAALGTFFKFDVIAARREAYLQHALSRSSQIGGSQGLGYSVYRGRNTLLNLTFTPSGSGVYEKYHVLGTIKDRDLVLLESTVYNAGTPLTVQVAIGEVFEETKTAPSDALNIFRFTERGVSEDVLIFIDDVEVVTSKVSKDLIDDKFVLQSNPVGSVDARYLNQLTATTRYDTGGEIKLKWINLKEITFILADIALDETEGVLTASEIDVAYDGPEEESSIKVNAPLNNEVQQTIRARNDQHKQFRALDSTILDANGEDKTEAAEFRVFYIRENNFLFDQTEKDDLVDAFEIHRPHGVRPPEIADPTRRLIKLKIDITSSGVVGDVVGDTTALITPLENILGAIIQLQDLEASRIVESSALNCLC